ncbi:MAG: hypothetical protein WD532_09680 [Acidimicrobiia bacterium]
MSVLCAVVALPALAQSDPNPIDEFLSAINAPENAEWVSQFLRPPSEGTGAISDPVGDIGHSSGDPAGYTPDHIDIIDTWSVDFDRSVFLFGPTDDGIWSIGQNETPLPNDRIMWTYTGEQPQDGSQYADGAWLFGMTTLGEPPPMVPGRCEFVIWVNDPAVGPTWENRPAFPDDPAGGTNSAFGIGYNPDGTSGTFTLQMNDDGFFQSVPEIDVRAFVIGDYTGIFVPKQAVPSIEALNFYTFCVNEGFSFSAEDTGSDQTGLTFVDPDADFGIVQIIAQSTTTTTEATTTTTAPPTTTTVETTTTVVSTTTAGESGFPWILVLGGGLLLALLGWWLYNRGDPCADELAAWQTAQRACDEARARAAEAAEKCEEAADDRRDLEDLRKEVCRDWPPACGGGGDDAWVEDDQGNRVTSRDLHMKKLALGQVWADYQAGEITAQEVEAKWREADTPEFREDMRERDAEAKAELERLDGELEKASRAEKEACDASDKAKKEADAACAEADAARRRYEECVGSAVSGGTAGGSTGGSPTGPSGPGVASGGPESGSDPCDGQPPKKVEPAGSPESINVTVDFALIVEAWEGSERNTAAGEQLVVDLTNIANELDLVTDLMSARGAGGDIAGGVNNLATGKFIVGTAGIAKGGVGAYLLTKKNVPDIPTTLPLAIVEGLELAAKFGARIAAKVTEWMTNYQVMEARVTYFTQRVTATPYTVWECQQGVGWVCVERIWEYEIGALGRRPGPRSASHMMNSNVARARAEKDFARLGRVAANAVLNDAKKLAEFRASHRGGPCQ